MPYEFQDVERREIREAIKKHDTALSLSRTIELATLLELPDDMTDILVETVRGRLASIEKGHYKVAKATERLTEAFTPREIMLTGEVPADDEPLPSLTLKTLATILRDVPETASVTLPLHSVPYEAAEPAERDGDDEAWRDDALCAQIDGDLFFPEKGGSTREAKRICQECVVSQQCLKYALDYDERFGIWGGLSERERRKLKRTNAG